MGGSPDGSDAAGRPRMIGMELVWVPSNDGTVTFETDSIVASAGADHCFALHDLAEEVVTELAELWSGPIHSETLSPMGRDAIDQLALLGTVRLQPPRSGTAVAYAVQVAFAGATIPVLANAVAEALSHIPAVQETDAASPDLVIWIRTTATLAETAEAASAGGPVHLFVDVAYHHTVSLGPLVVGGETACLHWLAGRIWSRWGDPQPPAEPLAAGQASLIAGLIAVETERIALGISDMANRTVAFDLAQWRVVDETLLRLPQCPKCGTASTPLIPTGDRQ